MSFPTEKVIRKKYLRDDIKDYNENYIYRVIKQLEKELSRAKTIGMVNAINNIIKELDLQYRIYE